MFLLDSLHILSVCDSVSGWWVGHRLTVDKSCEARMTNAKPMRMTAS